ncbi:uncharacterized protein LOC108158213 [Drosophila miranda]|uniref:uncharacterized protein LOC108158213 n=1 Tax=Drosophila miranda TaxID=7229 RepID=UPI0007E63DE0|nr:uncharacterized protein LOC108158213 [Drosophila miranda]
MDKRPEALTFRVLRRSRDFPALLPVCMLLDRYCIYDRVHRVHYLFASTFYDVRRTCFAGAYNTDNVLPPAPCITSSALTCSLWTQTAMPRSFRLPRLLVAPFGGKE